MFFSKCKDIYNPRAMRVKDTLDFAYELREKAPQKFDTYEEYRQMYSDPTDIMYMSEIEWDKRKPMRSVFNSKLANIINIFKEWENDINRTGEKLYR